MSQESRVAGPASGRRPGPGADTGADTAALSGAPDDALDCRKATPGAVAEPLLLSARA
jgi:hypothetical protein